MKGILFNIIRKIVFGIVYLNDHYFKRFLKEYYTKFLYDKAFNIGYDVRVNGKITVICYRGLSVGNNVHIGGNCFLHADGGIIIGDNTHISRNVTIYSASHNYTGTVLPYDRRLKTKSVIIEKNVWIGMNVSIAPGVNIGEGAIIGIGCIINRDVKAGEIIVQSGMSKVSNRNSEHYKNLETKNLYGGAGGAELSLKQINKFYTPIKDSKQQIFIVSTGRSGSQSVASILNQHPKIFGLHEPHWQYFKASTEFEYNIIGEDEIIRLLNGIYGIPGIVPHGFSYAESDQKLSNLIPILNKYFPNAKFIWTIRSAKKFVKSAYTRGWYEEENNFDQKGRLLLDPKYRSRACRVEGDRVGDLESNVWRNMSSFEKCCWYWTYWNKKIENDLKGIPNERWIRIDIDKMDEEVNNLNAFLNIEGYRFENEHKNKAHYTYKKKYKQFSYNNEQLRVLNEYCGSESKRWFD